MDADLDDHSKYLLFKSCAQTSMFHLLSLDVYYPLTS
jgi:hypothetical protein